MEQNAYLCSVFQKHLGFSTLESPVFKSHLIIFMYSKDDLLSKDIPELLDIAASIGADTKSDDRDTLIYAILDRQADVEGSKNPATTKRKRVRIAKKDTDHVYSVSGKEGENFDLKKSKPATEPLPLFPDEPIPAAPAEVREAPAEPLLRKLPKPPRKSKTMQRRCRQKSHS